jgi:hypothetical protein
MNEVVALWTTLAVIEASLRKFVQAKRLGQ